MEHLPERRKRDDRLRYANVIASVVPTIRLRQTARALAIRRLFPTGR
jgi:hypothetical protein